MARKSKPTATLQFADHQTVRSSKDHICRELEYRGWMDFAHYEATCRNGIVRITDTKSKITIKMTFDDFEYRFLFGEPVEGAIVDPKH